MRPIHLARLDKTRPAVVLTREFVRARRNWITVAPITSTVHGLTVEVAVGRPNGLDHNSVINCDGVTTIPATDLGRLVGYLTSEQEVKLAAAIMNAFGFDIQSVESQP